MNTVQSWDVFDTLIARTVPHPTDIFSIIEKSFPYPLFKDKRIYAEHSSNGTIQDIYSKFQQITGESNERIEELRQYELEVEKANTIPIQTNIQKMKPDDILISDMYLTEENILELLKHHNIVNFKKLYVYVGGKHHGFAWDQLSKIYTISNHTGDNVHSDVNMPKNYGINGTYTDSYKFTPFETLLLSNEPSLSRLFRYFRLSNPYPENSTEFRLFNEQINYNIPILVFACHKLADILEKEGRKTVLFITRDGCLITKLFRLLYPNFTIIYFHSSRIMNKNYNSDYIEYIKSVYNKDTCIFFDIHGSYETARPMFMEHFGHLPRVLLLQYNWITPPFNGLSWLVETRNDSIEHLNADVIGTLSNFIGKNDVRMPLEYNYDLVKINHQTVDAFCSYIQQEAFIPVLLSSEYLKNSDTMVPFHLSNMENEFVIKQNSIKQSLTGLANKYNSDKGDSYKCAHNYTLKYEEIIDIIVNKYKVRRPKLLEIGLNRDNTDRIPSLMIWNDYFNTNIDITGFDIQSDFLKMNGKYDNIHILIGDQSDITDLNQLKDKLYHIIIDDGYHASKHQQISFKTLWDNVEPNGFYIIEDLHYQPEYETCIKTRAMFEGWLLGNYISTEYISDIEISEIKKTIKSIQFYDTKSKIWQDNKNALVVIHKQSNTEL